MFGLLIEMEVETGNDYMAAIFGSIQLKV